MLNLQLNLRYLAVLLAFSLKPGRTPVSFRYVVLVFRSSFSLVPFPSRARTSRLPTRWARFLFRERCNAGTWCGSSLHIVGSRQAVRAAQVPAKVWDRSSNKGYKAGTPPLGQTDNLGTLLEWTHVSVLESLLRPHGSRLGWKLVCANSFKLCG